MNSRIAAATAALTSALALLALSPARGDAATVAVVVEGSLHRIVFEASAGEANSVAVAVVGELGDPTIYSVADATAPITAGPGCSGGGPAGSGATCPLPRSALPCVIRGCPQVPPVTNEIEINLEDGDDSLDSTGVPARDGGTGILTLVGNGGPGVDGFTDGPNGADFDPGPGADTVTGGLGYDTVIASAGSIDEADVYDLGIGPQDTVDYRAATYPLTVSFDDLANDGGAGEGDQVLGAEVVLAGSADDHLIGADSAVEQLDGLDGNDLIEAGPGYDLVNGGSGDDTIRGERGRDRLYGDGVQTVDGDDDLSGGVGRDFVQGYGGEDRLRGGFGADQLVGATSVEPDEETDRLDCGPTRDRLTYAGREDRIRRCERVRFAGA